MKPSEIFLYAAKHKLRFTSPTGGSGLTTEHLFDLPLESARGLSLDSVSEIAMREAAATPRLSLVVQPTAVDKTSEVKIAILEEVIRIKREANAAKVERAANQARIVKIKEALLAKDDKAIGKSSRKELEAELEKLQG